MRRDDDGPEDDLEQIELLQAEFEEKMMTGPIDPHDPIFGQAQDVQFEQLVNSNGFQYWWASDLARTLGYHSPAAFRGPLNKAMVVCHSLGINIMDNFVGQRRVQDGKVVEDTKLTRFACYLVALNCDSKKREVARLQGYFAAMAVACWRYFQEADEHVDAVERVHIRSEIRDREKSLSGVAKAAGVIHQDLFRNAGYRGMYNMHISDLRRLRQISPKRSPLDFMGKTEMAANLFRITQTEEKIKNEEIYGQTRCEHTAETVGREVRETMIRLNKTAPEDLLPAQDIQDVRSTLKEAQRSMKLIDEPKRG